MRQIRATSIFSITSEQFQTEQYIRGPFKGVILGLYRGYIGTMENKMETTKSDSRAPCLRRLEWHLHETSAHLKGLYVGSCRLSGFRRWMRVGLCEGGMGGFRAECYL